MHPVTRVVPSIEVGTTSTGDFVSHDHRIGERLERIVHFTDALEAQQQAAKLILPTEDALNGPEAFFEDCRIEVLLAIAFRGFAATRILGDIRRRTSIEDGLAVGPAVV